ncbi:MAG: hypothetical protein LBT53_01770 [Puniceicoccales bacterium]|jgi:hypothetical protein|nr:hypothetical protein [Puniceicoccales bacterium]
MPAENTQTPARFFATRRPARLAAAVLVLLAGGWLLAPVGGPAARWQAASQPAFRANSLEGLLGQGMLLGVFGGFRDIMANFAWLRGYVHWANHDRAACETYMRLAISLDPANAYFWTGYADTEGYDMAAWEIREREGRHRGSMPAARRAEIRRRRAERGLALLAEGAARCPSEDGEFWWKSAVLCASRLQDWERCAEFYRRSAEAAKPARAAELSYVSILTERLKRGDDAVRWLRGRAKQAAAQAKPELAKEYEAWAIAWENGLKKRAR